jgi:hypothetical protein
MPWFSLNLSFLLNFLVSVRRPSSQNATRRGRRRELDSEIAEEGLGRKEWGGICANLSVESGGNTRHWKRKSEDNHRDKLARAGLRNQGARCREGSCRMCAATLSLTGKRLTAIGGCTRAIARRAEES